MSGSIYGDHFKVATFGESHGVAIGVVIDGVTPNRELTKEDIQLELNRRRPGQSQLCTARQERDQVEILSGIFEGKTTGTPLAMMIRNSDQRSQDYRTISEIFRPGHADYTYQAKYGHRDYRGGGRSSGRETAARVAAGAVAKVLLRPYKVNILAHTIAIGTAKATTFDPTVIEQNPVRCADLEAATQMEACIRDAALHHDSVGGVVECRINGLPAGLGEPAFDKLDAELAKAIMSIGGVKGIEFGAGFAAASLRGSQNNDNILPEGRFASNNAGGILGGVSNGDDVIFRFAVKPTPSIAVFQKSVNRAGEAVDCQVLGRHDPCLCPRIVPVAEAMVAIVLINFFKAQAALLA